MPDISFLASESGDIFFKSASLIFVPFTKSAGISLERSSQP
jgi:hypothetical protein